MIASKTQSVVTPQGYQVIERIGAGGYGEVWRARAPGGVEKALKIVFGHISEELAERELKSLERIRSVRHPFLLSIERFDIVEGRLVIVTELADKSLNDHFLVYQEQQSSGIPREELLNYLWDAADALDCLAQRHSLQHLDIKPENILMMGDHGMVADFGLVKQLSSRTMHSMMGGMTPIYSAPEVFDDEPSIRSDQYSLAIVYQQMLTGVLPFSGRTPAQLAKQHTQSPPNVAPLPPDDQEILRRALAKQPQQRFATCREFIEALRSGRQASLPRSARSSSANTIAKAKEQSDGDTKQSSELQSQDTSTAELAVLSSSVRVNETGTRPARSSRPIYPKVDSTITDIPWQGVARISDKPLPPTLVIGLGGIGIEAMQHLQASASSDDSQQHIRDYLAIDVDATTLRSAPYGGSRESNTNVMHIPLRRPRHYRESANEMLRWVSRRWLYNIPRSLETKGYRPLGRIALVDHADSAIRELTETMRSVDSRSDASALQIVLLCGMAGGTGSAIAVDIAQAARGLGQDLQIDVSTQFVAINTFAASTGDMLAAANTFACLQEIMHAQRHGNCGDDTPPGIAARFESRREPFDSIEVVSLPQRGKDVERNLAFDSISTYVRARAKGDVTLASRSASDTEASSLGTFTCLNVNQLAQRLQHQDNELATADHSSLSINDRLQMVLNCSPLDCGYKRQAIVLASDFDDDCYLAPIRTLLPMAAVKKTSRPTSCVITLGDSLKPSHVASRLAESCPDVHEAAARLHTRKDLVWSSIF